MKKTLAAVLFFATSGMAQTIAPAVAPGDAATPAPTPAAPGGRGGGGAGNPVHGRNDQEGVDVDRFIGYPVNKTTHFSHAGLVTHNILTAGDPYSPGPNGAVMEYYKDLSTATLLPFSRTLLLTLPDSYMFYVESGEGRLEDGKQFWDLKPNMAILAPPNVAHRFINTSDKPLDMIMLTWTAGPDAHKELIVRDINLLPWCEENAHWNNESRCIFGANDGLLQGERVYLVMTQPFATNQPHSHTRGTAEIWVKVSPGTGLSLLGSELREIPRNAAYLVPPTGTIDHSNINLSKTDPEWWLYIARSPQGGGGGGRGSGNLNAAAGPAAPVVAAATVPAPGSGAPGGAPGGGGRGRGPQNPNISRPGDVGEATVAGKPIK
jgi:mannose-6-phosphate isomerase-like protein (cupin superfamily)